jgi:hypothetical protein
LEIADTLEWLIGTWRVDREIEDNQTGTRGSLSGVATLLPLSADDVDEYGIHARYSEEGELQFGAYAGTARRSLLYARLDAGSTMVYFADHRPFIRLNLRRGACSADHRCGDDRYEITARVHSHDVLQEQWRVRGPATDYAARAWLRRLSSLPSIS